MLNVLVGIAQPLIPSLVTAAITAGWIDPTTLAGVASILVAVGTALSSAATTVVKK